MSAAINRARDAFSLAFGSAPQGVAFAPGRVNLIGDHVDYNDGLVLPMPLTLGTAVAWRTREDERFVVQAADYPGAAYRFDPATNPPWQNGWHSLVHGMITMLHDLEVVASGLDLQIAGDLPRGAGLSSSASLCIATGRAVIEAVGAKRIGPVQLAQIAQQVEHRFAGVACGIMDQMAVAAGEPCAAMLLDCRSSSWETIKLPADWSVLIVQSGVVRELVDGAYNARRKQCEEAARKLGVASLRDVDPVAADFSGLNPVVARRALHVVSEIQRTSQAAAAIAANDLVELGKLFRESHASMRDSFEASHPEVDRQVDELNAIIGADGGARITGGGFGGAIVAVGHNRAATRIAANRRIADRMIRALN